MYSPNQIPWTEKGTETLLKEINSEGSPFYITIDTGHQTGQRKFLRPSAEEIRKGLRKTGKKNLWLGPASAYDIFRRLKKKEEITDSDVKLLERQMDGYPFLFAEEKDGDPYYSIEPPGRYSPIIHLQQTDGTSSSHLPFTPENNRKGIIKAEKVLQSLKKSYEKGQKEGMPPACKKIYLTIEVFSGTADLPCKIIENLRTTVNYWRRFIPEDGQALNKLL